MTGKEADTTAPPQQKRVIGKPFQKGQSGNPSGRPNGSRHKLDACFVKALYDDFRVNGVGAVVACRKEKPDVYLGVIAKILPRQIDVTGDKSIAALADGLSAVAEFLGAFAAEASAADLAGVVPDGPVLSAGPRAQTH